MAFVGRNNGVSLGHGILVMEIVVMSSKSNEETLTEETIVICCTCSHEAGNDICVGSHCDCEHD